MSLEGGARRAGRSPVGRARRWLAAVFVALVAGAVSLPVLAQPSAALEAVPPPIERPDIVVVMLDDVAADVVPQLLERMPTMRSLFVDHGVRFPNAVGQDPLCCPGRAGFLTGLTSRHHGVNTNDARLLDPRVTVATSLDAVGYHTMMVGKYLNLTELLPDLTPPGWDRVAISSGGYRDWTLFRQGRRIRYGSGAEAYSTDVFADQTMAWLRAAPTVPPRFLYLTPYATHGDSAAGKRLPTPAARHRDSPACADIGFRRTPAWNEADLGDRAGWPRRLQPLSKADGVGPRGWPLRPACEALLSVDAWVARVVAEQTRQGRLDRTLFVLTADNGMSWGDHRHMGKNVPWATPIPLYLHWPAVLGSAPAQNRASVMNIDLAPTLVAIGGGTLGGYHDGPASPDGRSLLPTILAGAAIGLDRTALFEEHRDPRLPTMQWSALRTTTAHPCGRWHYTEWIEGDRELFDLTSDPWELRNVAASFPAVVRQLSAELARWKAGQTVTGQVCAG